VFGFDVGFNMMTLQALFNYGLTSIAILSYYVLGGGGEDFLLFSRGSPMHQVPISVLKAFTICDLLKLLSHYEMSLHCSQFLKTHVEEKYGG